MRRKLIAGNWKMNGSLSANRELLSTLKAELNRSDCDVAVCAPAVYLPQCQAELNGSSIAWGGQDVSLHESGAFTGEISAGMLRDVGCRCVIVGHSERRSYHHESDDIVARKTVRALRSGLTPIVCVGESLTEREAGRTNEVVMRQLDAVLSLPEAGELANIVVAYEPVW